MQFQPYLTFDGDCEEAMRFYQRVLGGEIQMMMRMADAPQDCGPLPGGSGDRIMHACLVLDGSMLMASDSMPGQPFQKMTGFGVALNYPTAEAARPVFEALADGGNVMMPFGETFWADGFGGVTDRFGTPWMINGGPKKL